MRSTDFFQQYVPEVTLRPFVQEIWVLDLNVPFKRLGASSRVFPKGVSEIILPFRGQAKLKTDGATFNQLLEWPYLSGPQLKPRYLELTGKVGLLGVKLTFEGTRALTKMPANVLLEENIGLIDVVGFSAADCAEQIALATNTHERLHFVTNYLRLWLDLNFSPENSLQKMIRLLSQPSATHVPDLLNYTGLSKRQIQRLFLEQVGYSPKTLHRFLRFRQALQQIKAGKFDKISDVAFDSSYYDQAHFSREFKRFADVSPSQYVEQLRTFKV